MGMAPEVTRAIWRLVHFIPFVTDGGSLTPEGSIHVSEDITEWAGVDTRLAFFRRLDEIATLDQRQHAVLEDARFRMLGGRGADPSADAPEAPPSDGVEALAGPGPVAEEKGNKPQRQPLWKHPAVVAAVLGAVITAVTTIAVAVVTGRDEPVVHPSRDLAFETPVPTHSAEESAASFRGEVDASPVAGDPTVGVWSKAAQNSGPGGDPSSELVTSVRHGDSLTATCEAQGQPISNGAGYDSALWVRVQTPAGPGYLPNTWFARDSLPSLPSCY